MAVRWNRVFGRSQATCCPPSCYNFTIGCFDAQSGNVLDDFPLSVRTCGEAMSELGMQVKNRLCAKSVIVRSSSQMVYYLDVQLGNNQADAATVTLRLATSGCTFPISCSYVKGASRGSASFQELGQVVDYLAKSLK